MGRQSDSPSPAVELLLNVDPHDIVIFIICTGFRSVINLSNGVSASISNKNGHLTVSYFTVFNE